MTDALLAAALDLAEAEEARLDAMRLALLRGHHAEALALLRRHLGLDEEDDATPSDRPGASQHRGAGRA